MRNWVNLLYIPLCLIKKKLMLQIEIESKKGDKGGGEKKNIYIYKDHFVLLRLIYIIE